MEILLFIIIGLLAIQIFILIRMYDKDTTELNDMILKRDKEITKLNFRNEFLSEALDASMQMNKEYQVKNTKSKTTKRKETK